MVPLSKSRIGGSRSVAVATQAMAGCHRNIGPEARQPGIERTRRRQAGPDGPPMSQPGGRTPPGGTRHEAGKHDSMSMNGNDLNHR
ncbi:hypothetical protein V7x_40470 [Crateriforma conspicua]|uniref:Uncharacterized protein n=1 Tax=Crateriforma conspicua TaxID=2527996 RepID=A0A5C6FNT3_9PLAN|nr:hypothetical protein V7x_40410 [Crateriforma conspicua]TWU62318.1 hypothetical protein V7x_40470 [Crateriforma conspicua]